MKMITLGNNSMKTGLSKLTFDKVEYIKKNGKLVDSVRHEITLFLVSHRAYSLTLSNAPLMESIRKNVAASCHTADGVEVLAFIEENEARTAAEAI